VTQSLFSRLVLFRSSLQDTNGIVSEKDLTLSLRSIGARTAIWLAKLVIGLDVDQRTFLEAFQVVVLGRSEGEDAVPARPRLSTCAVRSGRGSLSSGGNDIGHVFLVILSNSGFGVSAQSTNKDEFCEVGSAGA